MHASPPFAFHSFTPCHVRLFQLLTRISADFQNRWATGSLLGWAGDALDDASGPTAPTPTAAAPTTAADAMDTGDGKPLTAAEAAALESNPLYCKACGKLFAKDTVFAAHLPGKKHKKNVEALEALGAAGAPPAATAATAAAVGGPSDAIASRFHAPATQVALWREIASVEYQIDMMATLLQDFVAATQAYVAMVNATYCHLLFF